MPDIEIADMEIVCIESNDILLRNRTVHAVAQKLRTDGMNVRVVTFPGDGPFAHQIHVALDQRTQYHQLPWHGLQLVDRMDFFLNPTNGFLKSSSKFDFLLISSSQYHECLQIKDPELSSWILAINAILPKPHLVLWISETEPDQTFDRLVNILPSARRFVSTPSNDLVDTICTYLKAEADHE